MVGIWGTWQACAGNCANHMDYKRDITCDDLAPFFGGQPCVGSDRQETDFGGYIALSMTASSFLLRIEKN